MTATQPKWSRSQRALAKLLVKEGKAFRTACESRGLSRVCLWRYAKGHQRPDPEQMFIIHDLSGGRITLAGWRLDSEEQQVA